MSFLHVLLYHPLVDFAYRLIALSLGTHLLQFEHRRKELWPVKLRIVHSHLSTAVLPFPCSLCVSNSPRPFRLRPSANEIGEQSALQ